MISRFQDAHPRPANHHSALFQTGGSSPLSARPASGLSAHTGTPRIAAHTGRPGPQPTSARIATAVAARNAATQGAMRQAIQGAKRIVRTPTQSFLEWQPGTYGRRGWYEMGKDEWGQDMFATRVQGVVVYSQRIDGKGSLAFFVTNPNNNSRVYFVPKGYIDSNKQFVGITTATGEFGRVYRNTLGVVVGGFATFGVALELEAGTAFLAASRDVIVRCSAQVAGHFSELGAKVVQEFTLKNLAIKSGVNFVVQFGSNWLTHEFDWHEGLNGVNYTSVVLAGILPEEERVMALLRNAVVTSTFKGRIQVDKTRGVHTSIEMPHFDSVYGIGTYLLDITTSVGADKVKGKLFERAGGSFGTKMTTWGDTGGTVLRWVSAQRVTLGTMGTFGGSIGMDAFTDKAKERLGDFLPGSEEAKKAEEARKRSGRR